VPARRSRAPPGLVDLQIGERFLYYTHNSRLPLRTTGEAWMLFYETVLNLKGHVTDEECRDTTYWITPKPECFNAAQPLTLHISGAHALILLRSPESNCINLRQPGTTIITSKLTSCALRGLAAAVLAFVNGKCFECTAAEEVELS
jgi:hypothetical protein